MKKLERARQAQKTFEGVAEDLGYATAWGSKRLTLVHPEQDRVLKVPYIYFAKDFPQAVESNQAELTAWQTSQSDIFVAAHASNFTGISDQLIRSMGDVRDAAKAIADKDSEFDFDQSLESMTLQMDRGKTFNRNSKNYQTMYRVVDDFTQKIGRQILKSERDLYPDFDAEVWERDPKGVAGAAIYRFAGNAGHALDPRNWAQDPADGLVKLIDYGNEGFATFAERYRDIVRSVVDETFPPHTEI